MKTAIFVGPTGKGLEHKLESLDPVQFGVFPPIQRLDLQSLHPDYSTVIIVDGYFRAVPAVGHQEIREALQTRRIIGCSSMGAIRACEMRDFGMEGYGEVYGMFCDDENFSDDEVVLLHTPAPRYLLGSEPLVNIRYFLKFLVNGGELTEGQAGTILDQLKSIYFGDRTLERLQLLLSDFLGIEAAKNAIAQLPDYRIKTRDFSDLLGDLEDYA